MIFERATIGRKTTIEGLGLHSGIPVIVTLRPADDGITFRNANGKWEAIPDNVEDTTRCTRLGGISTIEHLMSALCGLEITDVDVELTGSELPALDGASSEWVCLLLAAGRTRVGEGTLRDPFARLYIQDGDVKIAAGLGEGRWRYEFLTGARWPGAQVFEIEGLPARYAEEVAPARTFGFEEEIPHLQAMGLAKGLDLSKALVLGKEGYVNEPRFPDEPARHKLLDAMGDLYLSGVPARFLNVVAERSGHTAHVALAAKLKGATEPI